MTADGFHLQFDRAPFPVLALSADGALLAHNPAAAELAPGGSVDALLPVDHPALLSRGADSSDAVLPDGRVLVWSWVPATDAAGGLLIGRDVSKERAEAAVAADAERRYRLITGHTTDLVSRHAKDGTFLYASPAALPLLGYEPEELLGISSYDLFHPDDLRALMNRDARVHYEDGFYRTTYRIRRRTGEFTWFETTSRVLRDPQTREIREIVCLSRDVTRRIEAEEQARRHHHEQAHAARLSTMGEMATGMAHELNQPLGAIINYAQGSLNRLAASPELAAAALEPALRQIVDRAGHAAEIIRRVRRFVRKGPLQPTLMDLNERVRETVELCRWEAAQHEVELELELAPELPGLIGDPTHIQQVLLNLIRNAIEASNGKASSRVRVETSRPGPDTVAARVSDDGPGITVEPLERVFDPFYTSKPDGLGMGLSISRSIVEGVGGRLEVANNPGGGASFLCVLPLHGDDARAEEQQ